MIPASILLEKAKRISLRSSYQWSEGGDYFPSDYANEGSIKAALEIIPYLEAAVKIIEVQANALKIIDERCMNDYRKANASCSMICKDAQAKVQEILGGIE